MRRTLRRRCTWLKEVFLWRIYWVSSHKLPPRIVSFHIHSPHHAHASQLSSSSSAFVACVAAGRDAGGFAVALVLEAAAGLAVEVVGFFTRPLGNAFLGTAFACAWALNQPSKSGSPPSSKGMLEMLVFAVWVWLLLWALCSRSSAHERWDHRPYRPSHRQSLHLRSLVR